MASQSEGERQRVLKTLVERDERLLANIHEAIERYGETVTAYEVEMPQDVHAFVEGMREAGMRPVLVGGSVRDSFDGRAPKDLDFEVYPETRGQSMTTNDVARAARRFGKVDEVGKAFGVLKMTLPSGADLDLSVPRRENKVGVGHRGFAVQVDPTLTVSEAAERRDFTVNAMSYDSHLGVMIDPHGGADDLRNKVLRSVSDAFDEDPLRVLRGMQFSSRYGMTMDPATVEKCRSLRGEAGDLPVERVRGEWGKWATKGVKPSSGLKVLAQTGWDEVTPGLKGVASSSAVHRQVDVMRALLDSERGQGMDGRVVLGAVLARKMSDDAARAFLHHSIEGGKAQQQAFALSRSAPPPLDEVSARKEALSGKVSLRSRALFHQALKTPGAARGFEVAFRAGVADGPERDWADGNDILTAAGRPAGPWVGEVMADLRQAQAERQFKDRSGALEWISARIRS